MAQTLAELYVKISSDFAKVDADLSKLDHRIRGMDPSIQKMESGFGKANKAILAMGGIIAGIGIAKFGSDILKASTTLDTLNLMLINIEGSQAKANKRFEEFKILAKAPVLDPFNLSHSYVALRAVNVESTLAIRFMKGLGNAMAGVGAGNEQFKNAMYQVVQMAGATKLLGQDLRVINESFPQMRKYLAEAFGTADPEALAKKGVTAIDIMTKLSDIFEKLPRFAGGAQAAQDNFKQSLMLLEGALGTTVLPSFTKLITKITELMDKFNAMPEATKNVIGKAVVGGLGILGIGAALSSVLIIAGQVKSALIGLGAVNVGSGVTKALAGSAGAGITAGATSGAIAGAVVKQGFTIGTALMTIGKLSIVAGTVAMAYGVADRIKKSGVGLWGDTEASQDWFARQTQGAYGELGYDPFNYIKSYKKNTSMGIKTTLPTGGSLEDYLSAQAKKITEITPTFTGQAGEIPSFLGGGKAIADITGTYRDVNMPAYEQDRGSLETFNKVFGEIGGMPIPNITADLTEFGKELQAKSDILASLEKLTPETIGGAKGFREGLGISGAGTGFDIKHWEKIQGIINSTSLFNESKVSSLADEWDGVTEEMSGGIEKTGIAWGALTKNILTGLDSAISLAEKLGEKLGWDEWHYKDPELEKQRQESEKKYEKEKTGWGHAMGVSKGAAEGAATGAMIGSFIPGIGTAIGATIGAIIGGIGGYAEGGWVMNPQLAMVGEREPELIIPKSKLGSSGIGGNTHIEIHNINIPTMDRAMAENVVVQAFTDAQRHGRLN